MTSIFEYYQMKKMIDANKAGQQFSIFPANDAGHPTLSQSASSIPQAGIQLQNSGQVNALKGPEVGLSGPSVEPAAGLSVEANKKKLKPLEIFKLW